MNKLHHLLSIAIIAFPINAFAGAKVVEGDESVKLYQADKGKAQVLVQQNKEFILRAPDGKETPKPGVITVKTGERFYIVNEEHSFVHNVYDESDSSWLLRKQEPSKVAAITFDKPGTHKLRCAIHPTMKTELHVIP
jgi:plastocyanin